MFFDMWVIVPIVMAVTFFFALMMVKRNRKNKQEQSKLEGEDDGTDKT